MYSARLPSSRFGAQVRKLFADFRRLIRSDGAQIEMASCEVKRVAVDVRQPGFAGLRRRAGRALARVGADGVGRAAEVVELDVDHGLRRICSNK